MSIDLRRTLSPDVFHLFLRNRDVSRCFKIVRVHQSQIYFISDEKICDIFFEAMLPAGADQGVLRIDAPDIQFVETKKISGKEVYLHVLDIKNSDFTITNRRLSKRVSITTAMPIRFNVFGEEVQALIENISVGGVRLKTTIPVKKNIHCSLILKLSDESGPFSFATDGVVVYSSPENSGIRPSPAHVGIHFVTPLFETAEERQIHRDGLLRFRSYLGH